MNGSRTAPPEIAPREERPLRFFIETWGCQMNELDSQRMAGQLLRQGMLRTPVAAEADVILLNSCSVREKAESKAYSRLGEYRLLKAERPDLRIGFCGCVAQQEGERALERVPDLDFVVGTGRVGELGRISAQSRETGERIVAIGFPEARRYDLDAISRDGQYKGMVTIIEGCNKRCTFCIVPTTRGPELSRSSEAILQEVRGLVAQGFVEIELLGQTVNHWREPGDRDLDFADLLDLVAAVPGVRRLRFVTSYPRDFTARMVERFGTLTNLCPALHLPVQSGSDSVLRRMGRGYTVEEYLRLVDRLRSTRSDINLSTDFIVGFPGETEADFERTLDLIRQVRFGSIYAFTYSPRPGTAALRLDGELPDEVAKQRLQRLFATQEPIQRELNEALVGETLEVLVTGDSRKPGVRAGSTGSRAGRTGCHRILHFESASARAVAAGQLTRARVLRATNHSLVGEEATQNGVTEATAPVAADLVVLSRDAVS